MLKIRLQRKGRKGVPVYWVVVADARAPRDGKFLKKVGSYHPLKDSDKAQFEVDTVKHYVECGAQMTDRVQRLWKGYAPAAA